MVLPFYKKLLPALSAGGLNSKERVVNVSNEIGSIISYIRITNDTISTKIISFKEKLAI